MQGEVILLLCFTSVDSFNFLQILRLFFFFFFKSIFLRLYGPGSFKSWIGVV